MAIHSRVLTWDSPGKTEEPSGLQSMGLQKVRYAERLALYIGEKDSYWQ